MQKEVNTILQNKYHPAKIPALYKGRVGRGIIILLFLFIFLTNSARAGLIFQHPNYTGLNQGLVGYWSFNDNDMAGNTAYDRSGQGNNGTLTNGPTRVLGKLGQGLSFTNTNQYVNAGSAASLDNMSPVTVSAWIYANSDRIDAGGGNIIAKLSGGVGWRFGFRTSGTMAITMVLNALTFRAAPNNIILSKTWTHVVLVWDGSGTAANAHFYINTVEPSYTTTTNVGRSDDNAVDLLIGNAGGGANTFDGSIDDVRIYNRALNGDEIKRLYKIGGTVHVNSSNVGNNDTLQKGLVGYWSFNDNDMAGNTAYDRSGQGNNGTLTNGPVRTVGKIGQALNFDGVNDVVAIDSISPSISSGSFAVSLWFSPQINFSGATRQILFTLGDTPSTNDIRICLGDSFQDDKCHSPPKQLCLGLYTGSGWADACSTQTSWTANTWHHVVGVFDNLSGSSIFVDGSLVGSNTNVTRGSTASLMAAIGRLANQNATIFNGSIDDVRIYNRVLTADEIKRLYKIGGTVHVNSSNVGNNDTLQKGLVGYWSFNDNDMAGNTAYDRSGQGNNGTLTNGPVRTVGKLGQALDFDGVNDYVSIPGSSPLNIDTFTVSFWFKATSTNNGTVILNRTRAVGAVYNFDYGVVNPGFFEMQGWAGFQNTLKTSAANVPANTWNHIVGISDGGASGGLGYLYVNGVLRASGTYWVTNDTPNSLELGRAVSGYFGGPIDDVRIYNRVLSSDEIKRLYNLGR